MVVPANLVFDILSASKLGELGLFFTLALEALIFSRIEGWGYFDGIYFSLVVSLTIGYGDYVPTHTSTKVLLFPFAIITVACKSITSSSTVLSVL